VSVTEPNTDGVQPDAGQGDGGSTPGDLPYADYLNRLSEEVRGEAEPIFADWNANVNRKFEEHAAYRKDWEPYEPLRQHTPDQLQEALQFANAAQNDPAALRAWLDQVHGPVTPAQEPQQPSEDFAFLDPQQQYEKTLEERLGPLQQQLEQFTEWRAKLEQQAVEAQINEQIEAAIAELKAGEAKDLPKEILDGFDATIKRFASEYAEAGANPRDVVAKGWADLQAILNVAQKAALQSKVNQPETPAEPGPGDVAPPALKGKNVLREAERIAREQIRANRAA
jgi:hypothetical protein